MLEFAADRLEVGRDRAGRLHAIASSRRLTRSILPLGVSGIAPTLPALLRAYHIGMRATSVGFDWAGAGDVVDKIQEEVTELREAVGASSTGVIDQERAEEEMGDLLFAAVNLARFLQVDPEIALKNANAKFMRRFREMERLSHENGRPFAEVPRAEKEKLWEAAKRTESGRGERRPAKSEAAGKR